MKVIRLKYHHVASKTIYIATIYIARFISPETGERSDSINVSINYAKLGQNFHPRSAFDFRIMGKY